MKEHEYKQFQRVLELRHQETLRSIRRAEKEGRGSQADYPLDTGDRSVNNLSKELLFQQNTQQRQLLRRIEGSLLRIRNGNFGKCLGCGNEIGLKRLEVMPFAALCRDCQASLEREEKPGSIELSHKFY